MPMEITDHSADAAQILAAIVESSHDAVVGKDLNGTITTWNSGATRLFGYTAEEIIGKSVTTLIPPDRQEEETNILQRVRAGERIAPFDTIRRHKNGHLIEVSLSISPIRNAQGRVVGASKIARDITEAQRLKKQQALLLGEMKHRIKNLLTVMDALGRNAIPNGDAHIEPFFVGFMGRMRALLSAGEIVVSSLSNRADLVEIATTALQPFIDTNGPPRIKVSGPALWLTENTAGSLALALHELATNALKYGALKTPEGKVELAWSVGHATPDEQMVTIVWKEHGREPISQPTTRGFGSRLIKMAVTSEKNGRTILQYEPDGLRCTFEFATPERRELP